MRMMELCVGGNFKLFFRRVAANNFNDLSDDVTTGVAGRHTENSQNIPCFGRHRWRTASCSWWVKFSGTRHTHGVEISCLGGCGVTSFAVKVRPQTSAWGDEEMRIKTRLRASRHSNTTMKSLRRWKASTRFILVSDNHPDAPQRDHRAITTRNQQTYAQMQEYHATIVVGGTGNAQTLQSAVTR